LATDVAPAAPVPHAATISGKTLNERLLDAARGGRLDEVKVLLHEGAKVDARDDSFSTPLLLAASTGNVETVQALLRAGADVNAQEGVNGTTALMFAATRGNVPLVRVLLGARAQVNLKDPVGRTALHLAARGGRIEVMELLLAAGADVSVQANFPGTPLFMAVVRGNSDAVRCLLRHGCSVRARNNDGETPLHLAVIGGSNDVIQILLEAGADINAPDTNEGQTALMWAAQQSEQVAALQFLIRSRADLNKTDNLGWTALMWAKRSGHEEAARILKQAGGEEYTNLSYAAANGDLAAVQSLLVAKPGVNRPRQKELDDALCTAVQNPQAAIVKELLAHGANPSARLNGDQTPLTDACRGDVEIARQLLAAGADVNQSRKFGITPLMHAAGYMPAEFVGELIAKGARVNATSERYVSAAAWAAFGGKLENMKVLVAHGADINIHVGNPDGYIGWPLITAIRQGKVALADFLLAHGADIDTRDSHGKTALMYAVQRNQVDVAKLLIARGANVLAQADYDCNNTALKLAENTGKMEMAAVLRIVEFEKGSSGEPRHWGTKLARALDESTRAQIDNHPPNNTAWLGLMKEIAVAPDVDPVIKADARYLAAMADLEVLKVSGPVSNATARAAMEADIADLQKNHAGDARTTSAQQQWAALQQRWVADRQSRAETPLDLKFKAVDGTDVDLAKLRGKVVLVDFWATWCGPCRMEMPNVIAAYNQLHKDGFEIVGISLDQNKEQLVNFTKQAGMVWPQYFDGKGWGNDISSRYGIQSIPTMWLVDKKGFVRSTEARGDGLTNQVKTLLAE
jgi:ankyrin repeat protein/thiol-disulfide isomerase/thioredoxin